MLGKANLKSFRFGITPEFIHVEFLVERCVENYKIEVKVVHMLFETLQEAGLVGSLESFVVLVLHDL